MACLASTLVLAACSDEGSGADPASPRAAFYLAPAPLDELARAAAEELADQPDRLTLHGANGLERLGVRWKEQVWIDTARARFEQRLADPQPLDAREADAFHERYAELDLRAEWLDRLLSDDCAEQSVPRATWQTAMRWRDELAAAVESGDANALLAVWGRAHAFFGHVWFRDGLEAFSFDGFELNRADGGWTTIDRHGIARDFTLRRADGNASMRHAASSEPMFLPDEIGEH